MIDRKETEEFGTWEGVYLEKGMNKVGKNLM